MLKMSLDSKFTINPFDLEPGQTTPSKDHVAFLKTLTRYMIGGGGNYDADILDGILDQAIKTTYDRIASKRSGSKTPLYSAISRLTSKRTRSAASRRSKSWPTSRLSNSAHGLGRECMPTSSTVRPRCP